MANIGVALNNDSFNLMNTKQRELSSKMLNEEGASLKRSLDISSDSQPEAKKIAIANDYQRNGDMNNGLKGISNPLDISGLTVEQIIVPDRMVGLLIGKGGEQISIIQNETQCRVQFAQETGNVHRQCTLTGTPPGIMKAKDMINDVINRNQMVGAGGNSGSEEMTLEMMIPGVKVGLIIGKNGESIKQVQEKSGVRVVVIQDSHAPTTSDKPVRITGNKQGCQKARELVLEMLAENDKLGGQEMAVPGMGNMRGTNMNIPNMSNQASGLKINYEVAVPRALVGIVIGRGGEMIKKIQEESGSKVQFRPDDIDDHGPNRICHIFGIKQNNDMASNIIRDLVQNGLNRQNNNGGGMGGQFSQGGGPNQWMGNNGAGPGNMQQMSNSIIHVVPAEKCGLVIGKGGENIKEINRTSGAHAELLKDHQQNDPSVKKFRISGNQDQIQHCIRLINEKAGLQGQPQMNDGRSNFPMGPGGPMQPMGNQFIPINNGQGMMAGVGHGIMGGVGHVGIGGQMQQQIPLQQNQHIAPTQVIMHQPIQQQLQPQVAYAPHTGMPGMQYGQAVAIQYGQQIISQPSQAMITIDPSKQLGDGNQAGWQAYYQQQVNQQQTAIIQQQAGQGQIIGQGSVQAIQQQGSGLVGYANPGIQTQQTHIQYAAGAPTQQTQIIAASPVAAAVPQPTINPQTGQADYSLAWAEYYRQQGMHQQAAAIMQAAGQPG